LKEFEYLFKDEIKIYINSCKENRLDVTL